MGDIANDWRAEKKRATRERIRAAAMQLFHTTGYAGTTVGMIADAAGVTHTTFFRYFPTKEDVALSDEYDPLIFELIRQRPAREADAQKIRAAFVTGLSQVEGELREELLAQMRLVIATPALRARLWEGQSQTTQLVIDALGHDSFETRMMVSALVSTAGAAIVAWAEGGGAQRLPDLVDRAFGAVLGN